MADRERRLGKGLESLISSAREKTINTEIIKRSGHRVQAVPIDRIDPNPFQPRREFDIEALNELVESLRIHGLMQPIVVRKNQDRFQLVAGERRWRAAQELGWATLEGVIVEADDRKMLEWALIENVQRQDLGPIELAMAFREMMLRHGLTQEEVAASMSKSRPAVANHLRLLDLPESVRLRVSRGTVSMGAARAIIGLRDRAAQERVAADVEDGKLTVRQIEEMARERKSGEKLGVLDATPSAGAPPDPNLGALQEELQVLLSARVEIKGSHRKGRIVLRYRSARELNALITRLRQLGSAEIAFTDDSDTQGRLRV